MAFFTTRSSRLRNFYSPNHFHHWSTLVRQTTQPLEPTAPLAWAGAGLKQGGLGIRSASLEQKHQPYSTSSYLVSENPFKQMLAHLLRRGRTYIEPTVTGPRPFHMDLLHCHRSGLMRRLIRSRHTSGLETPGDPL